MSVKDLVYPVGQVEQDPQLSCGLILHYTSQGTAQISSAAAF